MISHKHKFIFIHIPKCAGTTIEKNLSNGHDIFDWNDINNKQVQNPLPFGYLRKEGLAKTINKFSDYYLFTFCRDPWARAVSAFLHQQRERKDDPFYMRKRPGTSFEDFLDGVSRYVLKKEDTGISKFEKYHTMPQVNFIPTYGKLYFGVEMRDEVKVDYIGRTERFDEDVRVVAQAIGINCNFIDKHYTSDYTKAWQKYYSARLVDVIYETYKCDIEYFKYKCSF